MEMRPCDLPPLGEGPRRPEPLCIQAHIDGAIALPGGPMAIDALLAFAIALRHNLPAPRIPDEVRPIEIPIARSPCGRFHLASFSDGRVESRERRWVNRRFPLAEAQAFGDAKLKRVLLSGGPSKSYRLPLETLHLEHDLLTWWCVGDHEQIADLLRSVWYLGKKRSTGKGRVRRWDVTPCTPWGEGFPVVSREGKPLRPLPLDWPGLVDPEPGMRVLTYPYWIRSREELCAMPEGM